MKTIICACGRVHWTSDNLKQTYEYLSDHPRTSREIANRFSLSVQNANNRARALVALGMAKEADVRAHETGGIEKVWEAVPTSEKGCS